MLEVILGWIGQNQTIAWVSSLILSMSAVGVVINKYGPKIRKASKVAEKALSIVNSLLDAVEDKKVTKEEVEALLLEVTELQEILK